MLTERTACMGVWEVGDGESRGLERRSVRSEHLEQGRLRQGGKGACLWDLVFIERPLLRRFRLHG